MNEHTPITESKPEDIFLLEYIKGSASPEVTEVVEAWLCKNEGNKAILLDLAKIYFAHHTHQRIAARIPESAFEKIQNRIKGNQRKLWVKRYAMVAACLAFFVLGGLATYWMNPFQGDTQMITISSNAGMRTRLQLPDGTNVCLNSGSQIRYPSVFSKSKREVVLEGEAYFEVNHQPSHPFIVHMAKDQVRIKVLGTTFNAQSYADERRVETTLVDGKVVLEMKDMAGNIATRVLRPSEKVTFDLQNGLYEVKTVHTLQEIAWIDGKLMFKDTPLPEVLEELSYFYNVKFDVKDPVINSYRFTGTFENRQLSQVLDYLKISSNMDYVIHYTTEDDSKDMKYTVVQLRKRR